MEISESAWAKAKEWSSVANCESGAGVTTEIIARAIMEERRECAEIAQETYDFHMTVDGDNRAAAAACLISQAIRNK